MDSTLSYLKMAILKKEAKFLKHCRSQGHWRSNRANRDKSMNLVQLFNSRGTAVRGPRGQGVPLGAPHMLICPGLVVPPLSLLALALSGLWGGGRGEGRGGRLRAVPKVGSSKSAGLAYRRLDMIAICDNLWLLFYCHSMIAFAVLK